MLTPRLSYLFARYWDREASPEEREELMTLLRTGEHDEDFKILVGEAMMSTQVMEMNEDSAALILRSILGAKEKVSEKEIPVVPIFRKRVMKFAVAASLAGVIATGSYFLFFNKKETKPDQIVQNTKADIVAPKTNRASITLANGKKIFLDSAGKGILATQGNTKIEKLSDGKIAYNGYTQPKIAATEYNTLFNPRGSKVITLILSDGTQVWLNAESSIKYPVAFSGKLRTVEITGEAYFEVAHNAKMPFHVQAGKEIIEDIGTSFNVNAYSDEEATKTTLIEGSIQINLNKNTSKVLKPGEEAVIKNTENTEGLFVVQKDVDVEQVMAWKNGLFNFEGADLQNVLRQLGRWYDVDVVFEGKIPVRQFGGEMSRDLNLSQVLKTLEKMEVKFRIEGKKLIVLP